MAKRLNYLLKQGYSYEELDRSHAIPETIKVLLSNYGGSYEPHELENPYSISADAYLAFQNELEFAARRRNRERRFLSACCNHCDHAEQCCYSEISEECAQCLCESGRRKFPDESIHLFKPRGEFIARSIQDHDPEWMKLSPSTSSDKVMRHANLNCDIQDFGKEFSTILVEDSRVPEVAVKSLMRQKGVREPDIIKNIVDHSVDLQPVNVPVTELPTSVVLRGAKDPKLELDPNILYPTFFNSMYQAPYSCLNVDVVAQQNGICLFGKCVRLRTNDREWVHMNRKNLILIEPVISGIRDYNILQTNQRHAAMFQPP
jgi:hypothetical protein